MILGERGAVVGTQTAETSASSRFGTVSRQFIKFGLVGGTGVIVNLIVVIIARKVGLSLDTNEHDVFLNLLGTRWNIRYSHVYATLAFLVANIWNFQLNRSWTFRTKNRPNWFKQFFPFLFAGLSALIVNLIVITLLTNPTSPLALPTDIFDDSTGFRNRLYWANLIGVILGTPANFILNKIWTFRARKQKPEKYVLHPAEEMPN